MENFKNTEIASFILRVALGLVLIAHSLYLKMMVFTLAGTAQFFTAIGFPSWLAYVTFFTELVCGIALILGYKTQWFALIIIPILLGATWVHLPNGWLFSNQGGGYEYPLILVVMAIAQIFLGDGKYALSKSSTTH